MARCSRYTFPADVSPASRWYGRRILAPVGGLAWLMALAAAFLPAADAPAADKPVVLWPLGRTAYFVGEQAPLAVCGVPAGAEIQLTAIRDERATLLYHGPATALLLAANKLAPGDYRLAINGVPTGQRLTITGVLRRSAGSMQDEVTPREPQLPQNLEPEERAAATEKHWDGVAQTLRESGLTACLALGAADMGRAKYLDVMARAGALLLVNPDTRPTSFFPVGNLPAEIDGMSQRMILTAQANGRYPNFGGFCFGWDTTGYPVGGRKGLMTYWGWGDKTQALRNYIQRLDQHTNAEFTRRTGLAPVTESEYIAYLLSLGRPEFAPAIDLPSKLWLAEIGQHTRPMTAAERAQFERRLDAWSAYLMGLYREAYGQFRPTLHDVEPSLRNTASVQVDHQAVRNGQYFPSAYEPLDLQYQSTWNDQVGGPDYAYQWLLTAGLLEMHRGSKPTWLSNTFGPVHARAALPGKFPRVAAHGLPWGVSGIGFALEGFSNLLGGMNAGHSAWENIRGQAAEADVIAGREFLDRFSALAVAGRGEHGVGILFSRSQLQRQHFVAGFGTAHYRAFVALTRLGYTPRFVTEEDLEAGRIQGLAALVVIGQTFPLSGAGSTQALEKFVAGGGRLLTDANTTITLPRAEPLGIAFPFAIPGKPHNWSAPNMVRGENDALLYARWHPELAAAFTKALGNTGRGVFVSERGAETKVSLLQIDGGLEAKYVVAVNDSHVATQADWHQVRERLVPTGKLPAEWVVYDCTEEKRLGPLAAVGCDLSATTVRVFAVLPRTAAAIGLSAKQKLTAGEDLVVAAQVLDAAKQPLRGVVPLHLSLQAPDGRAGQDFYRSTDRDGQFALAIPLAANVPAGTWSVTVRSQLDGTTATLPIHVSAAAPGSCAVPLGGAALVRNRPALDQALRRGSKFVLPVFDTASSDELRPIAGRLEQVLAQRGVEVEIRPQPEIGTYWLAYDPTAEQQRENARIDAGERIGKIKRETVNGNDWYSALSGYRWGRSVILLDLTDPARAESPRPKTKAGPPVGNPLVAALDNAGLLWPPVSEVFPGPGRAVVQAVPWAFAPRTTAIVVQATDTVGLRAAVDAFANLPADPLTAGVRSVRSALWSQYHVGGPPPRPDTLAGLTNNGLRSGHAPRPFAIRFGSDRPLPPDRLPAPAATTPPAVPVPATILPKQYVLHYRDATGRFIETATAEFLNPDLRFSEAIMLVLDVPRPGKTRIIADGLFRYSDRQPMWQAQWEDIIHLREKLVPKERRPMVIEVQLADRAIGTLLPSRREQKEVPLELASPSAGLKPKTVVEEVVTRLEGTLDLPAGRQSVLLIHRHIVDGKLTAVGVGTEPQIPAK